MRTPITVAYITGLAKDFERTDLTKVAIEEVEVYFPEPNSSCLGGFEDAYGRSPTGVPFKDRKEAEGWLKVWVGKEITKLHDRIQEISAGLQVALGKDVNTIDDGVHG